MDFLISASSDVGNTKAVNQDSLLARVMRTAHGKIVFAALCDGMGGYTKGELASATVIRALTVWAERSSALFAKKYIEEQEILSQWKALITRENVKVRSYGSGLNICLGTTATIMLITEYQYCILHVGDSRAYEISDIITQLTEDQTVIAREISLGNITAEQAGTDPRRHILLECVGIREEVNSLMYSGETKKGAVYMLCSDGFRNRITEKEILDGLSPRVMTGCGKMKRQEELLIDLTKKRGETDNISVITIATVN